MEYDLRRDVAAGTARGSDSLISGRDSPYSAVAKKVATASSMGVDRPASEITRSNPNSMSTARQTMGAAARQGPKSAFRDRTLSRTSGRFGAWKIRRQDCPSRRPIRTKIQVGFHGKTVNEVARSRE